MTTLIAGVVCATGSALTGFTSSHSLAAGEGWMIGESSRNGGRLSSSLRFKLEIPRFNYPQRANREARAMAITGPKKNSAGGPPERKRSGARRERKRRTTVDTRPSRESGEVPTGVAAMAIALSHPLRVKILYAMNSPVRRMSATHIADLLGPDHDVKRISYHMRELSAMGFIQQVDERPVRGSLEKIYEPVKGLAAWDLEWSSMPEALKAILSANALGLAARALGASIDSGDFGKRDDSVLSQGTFWTDERGAVEALAILYKATEAMIAVEADTRARLADRGDDAEFFAISHFIGGYEGGVRPVE